MPANTSRCRVRETSRAKPSTGHELLKCIRNIFSNSLGVQKHLRHLLDSRLKSRKCWAETPAFRLSCKIVAGAKRWVHNQARQHFQDQLCQRVLPVLETLCCRVMRRRPIASAATGPSRFRRHLPHRAMPPHRPLHTRSPQSPKHPHCLGQRRAQAVWVPSKQWWPDSRIMSRERVRQPRALLRLGSS